MNRNGFKHTIESYCIVAHILFCARMYYDANRILREMVLSKAELKDCDVFDVLWSTRNVCVPGFGVFDALFSVLIEEDMFEEALQCFSKMKRCRVFPKTRSCNGLLHKFARLGKTDGMKRFFKDMIGAGSKPTVFTYNIMIDCMCKEGDIEAASGLFEEMKFRGLIPDTVTYNSMIDGYGKVGRLDDTVYFFEEMKSMSCEPDVITYNTLINCFCKFGKLPKGLEFFREMKQSGLKPNVVSYSTLVDAFCKEDMMQQALKFYVDMRRLGLVPNEHTYTSLVDAYCKIGNLSDAFRLADEMSQVGVEWNVVTYTALIDGLCDVERIKEAEELFGKMVTAGVIPNLASYTALIHGFVKAKNMDRALELLDEMKGRGIKPDLLLYGTFIWSLCGLEKIEAAKVVMNEMQEKGIKANTFIYTTLMDAYFKSENPSEGLHLLEEMLELDIEVTAVTFCVLIDGLCKNKLVSKAIDYFGRISNDFGLQANAAIYTAMIDGLCKEDQVEAATTLFEQMAQKGLVPDRTAYTSLIDGKLKQGNVVQALALRDKMAEIGVESGARFGDLCQNTIKLSLRMGARVGVQHYNLGSADSYISSSLNDLNSVDGPPRDIDGIGAAVGRDGDSLDNDGGSSSADCMHESYRNSMQIHNDVVEEGGSNMENKGSAYTMLNVEDVSPIESARGRFLQIILDYFISQHVIEVCENKRDHETGSGGGQDNNNTKVKRKSDDTKYEGDPSFALPLMYIANLYETLVGEANVRLASLTGIREKTIGVALEAAGGLYRKLTKKFPKKGACMYRRRELATSVETRTRFPELVIHEEKRVRFVVVNGLDIVEKPDNLPIEDAEWFKRLTGRNEVAVSARDYKFYCPRHKHRRVQNSVSSIHGLPTFPGMDSSTLANTQGFRSVSEDQSQQQQQQHTPSPSKHHMSSLSHHPHQFHQPIHQSHHHHQPIYQSQHAAAHFPGQNHQCDPELSHTHQSPSISQHMACLQPLTGGHVMPTSPAKFCDQCGAQYLRDTSKFCSECGCKRFGI
nr:putative PPR repeat protein [Eutrema halophilum]